MRALIDADIICYEFGNMKDLDTGEILPFPIVRSFVDERIENIIEGSQATEASFYLTDSKSNFRNNVATILPYKGQRPSEKPKHWQAIREHLVDNYDAKVIYGMEADDAVGIEQYQTACKMGFGGESDCWGSTIICSRDKDLSMVPGWHYSWESGNQKEKRWFVDETNGIRFFYKQLLTGDATDNILGLFKVGAKASCVKAIDDLDYELDMYCLVYKEYESRFGSYALKFLEENAKLLWRVYSNWNVERSWRG